jgi:hypothetical protein
MTVQRHTSTDKMPPCPPRSRRRPWLFIVVAIVAAISVVSGELWAIRQAPPVDGAAPSGMAGDVDRALARVAAASLLIGPAD